MAFRRGALLELGGGVTALAAAVSLLKAAAPPLPPPVKAVQTAKPSSPPAELGSRFDEDTALPAHAPPIASYTLSAKLDVPAHTVHGKGVIRFRNASTSALNELWLHLYLNAFKNEQSLFLRSPYGSGRGGSHARDWGYIDVKRLVARELGNRDLWPLADPHSPSEPNDQTDIRVPLPASLAPGDTLDLDVEFDARLPEIVERTGYRGSFHLVAQWFPKLAKLEPDGTWVHFPFHAQSEFYADYGDYRIDLDVPANFVAGATGRCTQERVQGERRLLRYEASDVHDFAWTAWDGFRERTESIDGVSVRMLYPAGYELARDRAFESLRAALPYFSRRYGRYPYPTLTVVHPPEYADAAGGMEYPTLITTGSAWYVPLSGARALESVTIHELGHQWFYGLIASDEHAWPFLDEGLNSYAELDVMEKTYGAGSLVSLPGLTVSTESGHRALAAIKAQDDAVALAAARFENFSALGSLVYSRTATILRTLANVYGQERVARALGRYARYYRFKNPTPKHFIAAMREALGEDAASTLETALFDRGTVDYVVGEVVSARVSKPAGVFDRESGRETVARATPDPSEHWAGRVAVHRHGALRFPVDVDLYAEDGTRQRRHWDGRGTWTAFDYRGKSPLVGAIVDPEQRVVLDDNLFNNATSKAGARTPRLLERTSYWTELLLAFFGP